MDEDENDYVLFGTPIEREEEVSARKRRSASDAGKLKTLPPWKQEVTDEEGRRRFHGAFTGGFSAGYYNTVGTKEGWEPQTFKSSRGNRADMKKQSIYSFLDEDEKAEMQGHELETSVQFDTFGFTAAELARKQAEQEQNKRPSAIPGPVPDELLLPAANSIGVKLLLKMGWRHGHSIKESRADSLYDARREARKALLAFSGSEARSADIQTDTIDSTNAAEHSERLGDGALASTSTPVFVLNPKQDLHGLGFDPFKHAPEFRERKKLCPGNMDRTNRGAGTLKEKLFTSNSGKIAPGFGIGALEELDVEDEDIYASGFDFEETYIEEDEQPLKRSVDSPLLLGHKTQGSIPGFKVASNSGYNVERFTPPVIPMDFKPLHKFSAPLETTFQYAEPPPPEVPPPEDNNLRLLIEGFATLVARCGKLFEDLSKEKNKTNPLFHFLNGGNGHGFYARKLWEEQQRCSDQNKKLMDTKSSPSVQKMTAESRGRILGERPLERRLDEPSISTDSSDVIQLQSNLSDTFTKPVSLSGSSEHSKPYKNDPAKQERFEQFLKDKYQGGLRSTYAGGSSNMSENDRARERLDFEAAAEAIQKGERRNNLSAQQFMESSILGQRQFTSAGVMDVHVPQKEAPQIENEGTSKIYPRREEYQWRPMPILCKRFDIVDPFMGKPPPLPRPKSKFDSLIFSSDLVSSFKVESTPSHNRDSVPAPLSETQDARQLTTIEEPDLEPISANVERPVDLYKAIFSDDSDDDEGNATSQQIRNPEKKAEAANATLNKLIAGDLLESLGKELGLEVPPDSHFMTQKTIISASQKEMVCTEDVQISRKNDASASSARLDNKVLESKDGRSRDAKGYTFSGKFQEMEVDTLIPSERNGIYHVNPETRTPVGPSRTANKVYSSVTPENVEEEKIEWQGDHRKSRPRRHRNSSSGSETDSSSERGFRDHSRSRTKKRDSSSSDSANHDRFKSRSKKKDSSRGDKRSKHHKRRRRETSRSPDHGNGRGHKDDHRGSRKSRDQRKDSGSSKSGGHRKHH
ncbi:hypothetical protein QJS04_geneDACA004984 [Acorus gramineus]|uniref:G patch domain-containing protein TGH homolog n=1 Tax=Acorus gramineus TaxID=55184 RepID=A0AAV9AUV6_ACOGR|nr:hypothetical protein QJS04_geneDACA004984 [Acorus gramineus]